MNLLKIKQPCVLCGDNSQNTTCLCNACRNELPYITSACTTCGLPLDTSTHTNICGACIATPPPIQHCISVLHYESPVDYLIKNMKYHNQLSIATLMGKLLAEKIKQDTLPLPELIIPTPLHMDRLRKRGYNQATEISKTISQELNIPLNLTAFTRSKSTSPQFDLPASERANNIKNAFNASDQITASHIALVDDIMTTGSTAWEMARTLKKAGINQVDLWVCARASANKLPS